MRTDLDAGTGGCPDLVTAKRQKTVCRQHRLASLYTDTGAPFKISRSRPQISRCCYGDVTTRVYPACNTTLHKARDSGRILKTRTTQYLTVLLLLVALSPRAHAADADPHVLKPTMTIMVTRYLRYFPTPTAAEPVYNQRRSLSTTPGAGGPGTTSLLQGR